MCNFSKVFVKLWSLFKLGPRLKLYKQHSKIWHPKRQNFPVSSRNNFIKDRSEQAILKSLICAHFCSLSQNALRRRRMWSRTRRPGWHAACAKQWWGRSTTSRDTSAHTTALSKTTPAGQSCSNAVCARSNSVATAPSTDTCSFTPERDLSVVTFAVLISPRTGTCIATSGGIFETEAPERARTRAIATAARMGAGCSLRGRGAARNSMTMDPPENLRDYTTRVTQRMTKCLWLAKKLGAPCVEPSWMACPL